MAPNGSPYRAVGEGYTYVGLGCSFAAGVVLFLAGGWLVDRWLHTVPLFTIAGTLLGTVASFLWVYAKLQGEEKRERDEADGGRR